MKSLIIIILLMVPLTKREVADDRFISVCMISKDSIRVDYLDSTHGISKIEKEINGDTLTVKIFVSKSTRNESKKIILQGNPVYIRFNSKTIKMGEIVMCKKIESGKGAIEELKKMKN